MIEAGSREDGIVSCLLVCTHCGWPQAGRVTDDGGVIPSAPVECGNCGSGAFAPVDAEDLGLKSGS